jgi:hypothetical protein
MVLRACSRRAGECLRPVVARLKLKTPHVELVRFRIAGDNGPSTVKPYGFDFTPIPSEVLVAAPTGASPSKAHDLLTH